MLQSVRNSKSVPTGRNATKVCTKCKQELCVSKFYEDNTRRSGKDRLMSQCMECSKKAGISKRLAAQKLWGTKSAVIIRQNRPPEGTPCQICSKPMIYKRNADLMCFDHDPETHEFRGWICQNCNTGIGKLGDTPEGVLKALDYLVRPTNLGTHQGGTDDLAAA